MAPPTPSLLRGTPPPTTLPQPREWATGKCISGWMPTGLQPERGPPSCYRAGPEAKAGSFPQKPLEALDPAPGQEARGWCPPSLSVEALFRGENEKMATPGDKASTSPAHQRRSRQKALPFRSLQGFGKQGVGGEGDSKELFQTSSKSTNLNRHCLATNHRTNKFVVL